MKVAIDARLVLDRPTGIGRVTLNLIENLARLDRSLDITALSEEGVIPALPEMPNVTHLKAPFGHLSVGMHVGMPRIIRQSGAQIVHYLYFVAPVYSPVPSVVTVHDTIYCHYPKLLPGWRRAIYGTIMRQVMGRAKLVICTSKSTADDVLRFFPGVPTSKIRIIYNGVEDRFAPAEYPNRAAARAELGLPERYILYVGNHRGHKNIARLVTAFSSIVSKVPHFLVMPRPAGRGAEITQGAVQERGVGNRVVFHEMPDDRLPDIYRLADSFLFPSLYEGFGLPALEAMASGTPVITSNTSSLPEVVGDAAITVDPTDVDALAVAMQRVLTAPELAEDLRRRGIEQAKRFTWQETARQTLAAYAAILES